jgi:hypothetical protein
VLKVKETFLKNEFYCRRTYCAITVSLVSLQVIRSKTITVNDQLYHCLVLRRFAIMNTVSLNSYRMHALTWLSIMVMLVPCCSLFPKGSIISINTVKLTMLKKPIVVISTLAEHQLAKTAILIRHNNETKKRLHLV